VESDDDIEDVEEEKVKVEEVEEDEIIESDVELEGETVEPDDDPPQKVILFFLQNYLQFIYVVFELLLKVNAHLVSDGRFFC
jgi:hypothetical protein